MSSSQRTRSLQGAMFIMISAFIYGLYGLFARWLEIYPLFFQNYIRCGIIAIIFILITYFRKEFKPIAKKDQIWFALFVFCSLFTIGPIFYAFQHLTLGTAAYLFYGSYSISSYIFGIILFKEKITSVKWIALGLAFAGMSLLFHFELTSSMLLPAFLAILGGLASSGEGTMTKKISGNYSNSYINIFLFGGIAISHFCISQLIGEEQTWAFITQSWPILVVFILIAMIGMVVFIEGYKRLDASIAALIGLSEIIFATLFGVLIFGERLSIFAILGGLLIIFAGALPEIVAYRQHQKNLQKK